MNILKNIHVWGLVGLLLQWFVNALPYAFPRAENHYQVSVLIGALLAFCILAIGHRQTRVEERTIEVQDMKSTEPARQAVKILSAMYAVIGGLSLTTAVKGFSSLENPSLGIEPTITFFATALPFYNGCTMFLITNYYQKGFEGRTREPLFDFLSLFSESIALYGMAINIANLLYFCISLMVLLFVDSMWVFYILIRRWRHEIPREWLWLNFYMFSFLPFLLLSPKSSVGILAIVAISRTITDYYVAGKYYLPP